MTPAILGVMPDLSWDTKGEAAGSWSSPRPLAHLIDSTDGQDAVKITRACSIDGCNRPHLARGWCHPHYDHWKAYGDPLRTRLIHEVCTIEGCGKPHLARGWCGMHLWRWRKHGDPNYKREVPTVCAAVGCEGSPRNQGLCIMHYSRQRRTGTTAAKVWEKTLAEVAPTFWAKVDRREIDEDWPWLGVVLKSTGYGQFGFNGKKWSAHRMAYTLAVAEIPEGLVIDHVRDRGCRRRDCVNPFHLEAVTQWENSRRARRQP